MDKRWLFYSFLFGGGHSARLTNMTEIYILSLPGFRWFRSPASAIEPRSLHTCHVVGNRQMLSIGGLESTYDYDDSLNNKTQWEKKDNFPQGLGIFDMTELKWSDRYDATAAAYDSPELVKSWYGGK